MGRERISRIENFTFANFAMNRFPLVFLQEVDRPLTPPMRFKEYEIAKRDGSYIYEDGYDRIQIKVKIRIKGKREERPALYRRLIEPWIAVEAPLIFDDEKDKFYKAKILNSIDYNEKDYFDEIGIVFLCEPFKYQLKGDAGDITTSNATMKMDEATMWTNRYEITTTKEMTFIVENNGNIDVKPLILISGTADLVAMEIGEYSFSVSDIKNQEVIIDCEKMIVYQIVNTKKVSKLKDFKGKFPVLKKGVNQVTIKGISSNLRVSVNYRNTFLI